MTAPALAFQRFAAACLLGLGLGVLYSFLRPLRPRRTALADGVFLAAVLFAWLQLGFRVCRGDLRLGYTAGLFVGLVLWELTVGKLLRPVFSGFWKGVVGILGLVTWPVKKFFEKIGQFIKFVFASLKKWGTIKWNNRRDMRRNTGGTHGSVQKSPGIHRSGISEKHGTDEDRSVGSRRIVYGSSADAPWRH